MKKLLLNPISVFSLFGFLILGFSNCDKIAEALSLEAPFSTHFIIDVTENDDLYFSDLKEIDLSSNQDFQNNKDKIDYFTLKQAYYKVVDYNGEAGILGSGAITFYNDTVQIGDPVIQENVDFNALFESGDETILSISEETKNAVQSTLKEEMKLTLKLEGLVTEKPVYVDVEIFLIIGAKVNP